MSVLSSSVRTFVVIAAAMAMALPISSANAAGLAGTWTGGGTVSFGSGSKEKARCRATFVRTSKFGYKLSAKCATSSGSVHQTATVRGSGSKYKGSYYNADWDARGIINITVSGRTQYVNLSGNKGSAQLRLRKR